MQIRLKQVGKRFNRQWIFRGLNYTFESGSSYAITGPNGSGKSTLLQVIAGALTHSEGKIEWYEQDVLLSPEHHFAKMAMAAPYLELIEELTLEEMLFYHFSFKPLIDGFTLQQVVDYLGLSAAKSRPIRYYSSGMKQRVKLALVFFSNVSVLVLDEPTSNLDEKGISLYLKMVAELSRKRLVLIGSNDIKEYAFCTRQISISEFAG